MDEEGKRCPSQHRPEELSSNSEASVINVVMSSIFPSDVVWTHSMSSQLCTVVYLTAVCHHQISDRRVNKRVTFIGNSITVLILKS